MGGSRSVQQSMRYYPTLRSSTSMLSVDKHSGMGLIDNDHRPFGIMPDMVKSNQ